MDFLSDVVNPIMKENPYVNTYSDVTGYIDTGSYLFNALLSGSIYKGMPGNKTTAFAGETSTGKTYFTLGIITEFLNANPESGVLYYESEGAITKQMIKERGINPDRFIPIPVATVQQFRHQTILAIDRFLSYDVKDRKPIMIVLDSLGQLSTTKEMEDTAEGKETKDMTRSQIIKAAFRVLDLKLGLANIPMIVTNHTYDSLTSKYPEKIMGGGGGLKFAADSIIFLSRRKEKDGTEIVGNVIHCRNTKSRLTKENKMVDVLLRYDTGLNRYYGLVDIACDAGIWNKLSTQIELPDGKKHYAKHIYKNPEKFFTKEVLDKIDKYCQEEFLYGSTIHDEELDDGAVESSEETTKKK